MKQRAWAPWVVSSVVGGMLLASACSGKSISHRDPGVDDDVAPRGGTAGTIDRGGTSGTGPRTRPTGGVAGSTFPEGGTAGTSGVGGASGSGGVAPSCTAGGGPLASPASRHTIPFVLTPGNGGSAGAGGAPSEASDLELSGAGGWSGELDGCAPRPYGYECVGEARASLVERSLTFTFNDDSMLEWTGNGGATVIAPPRVANGERLFIKNLEETPPVCAFCGSTSNTSILITRLGQVIWRGVEGSRLDELDVNFVRYQLGVPYRRALACVVPPFAVDCYSVERELYDVVLETTPEQWIPFATPTVVSTPQGEFEVIWASSEQTEYRDPGCDDGRLPAQDRGFAMSRL